MPDSAMLNVSDTQDRPRRISGPLLRCRSLNRPYEPTLPAIPQIVENKLFSDIKSLEPVFDSCDIPWIEHSFKSTKNKEYREVARKVRLFTRTRRRSSVILKLSDILKILYLTRTRNVAQIRTRLALLEMWHRRRCANRLNRFNLKELRRLIGGTRITDGEALAIAKSPRIEVDSFELRNLMADLGRDDLNRPVWVPRRLLRYLAKKGTRLEIASMMVLLARRMHGRMGRARCSARLVARVTGSRERHVRTALLSLQEKKLILRNRQAERWSVNRYGTLWEFPSDLTINPEGTTAPARKPPKQRGIYRNLSFADYLKASLGTPSKQKGAHLINTDPTLQVEPLLLMSQVGKIAPPSRAEVVTDRLKQAAAAAALEFFGGDQGEVYRRSWSNVHDAAAAAEVFSVWGFGVYEQWRQQYPPHVPERRLVDDKARNTGWPGCGCAPGFTRDDDGDPAARETPVVGDAKEVDPGLYGFVLEDYGERYAYRSTVLGGRLGLVGRGWAV